MSDERAELADVETKLLRFPTSSGAQRAAGARVERKLGELEVKERELRSNGDAEQAEHAKKNVEKGKKVEDKRQSVEQLERSVARL